MSYVLIYIEDFEGAKRYAKYDHFRISDEEGKFKLSLRLYSGTAGKCGLLVSDLILTIADLILLRSYTKITICDIDISINEFLYRHSSFSFVSLISSGVLIYHDDVR